MKKHILLMLIAGLASLNTHPYHKELYESEPEAKAAGCVYAAVEYGTDLAHLSVHTRLYGVKLTRAELEHLISMQRDIGTLGGEGRALVLRVLRDRAVKVLQARKSDLFGALTAWVMRDRNPWDALEKFDNKVVIPTLRANLPRYAEILRRPTYMPRPILETPEILSRLLFPENDITFFNEELAEATLKLEDKSLQPHIKSLYETKLHYGPLSLMSPGEHQHLETVDEEGVPAAPPAPPAAPVLDEEHILGLRFDLSGIEGKK
ncbi:hypothetical protein HN446_03510 [bacterium]|nr:hypothetical protein [bacterium]